MSVFVTPAMIIVRDQDGDHHYPLPSAAQQFQERFDRATWDDVDSYVDPVSFEVHRSFSRVRRETPYRLRSNAGECPPDDSWCAGSAGK